MNPGPFNSLPGEVIENRMFDNGEMIVTVSYSKQIEQIGNGPLITRTRVDSFRTVDGVIFNPIYSTGQERILLAACHVCRHPEANGLFSFAKPCHGLCTLPNARQCHKCGITVCPTHYVLKASKAFCRRCYRRKRLWTFIKPLFFRRIDE